MKKTKRGRPKGWSPKKEIFKIETHAPTKAYAGGQLVEKAVNTVFQLRKNTHDSFTVNRSEMNGVKPQSFSQILRNKLKLVNKDTGIKTSVLGDPKSPTAVRIWRTS